MLKVITILPNTPNNIPGIRNLSCPITNKMTFSIIKNSFRFQRNSFFIFEALDIRIKLFKHIGYACFINLKTNRELPSNVIESISWH